MLLGVAFALSAMGMAFSANWTLAAAGACVAMAGMRLLLVSLSDE